MKIVFNNMEPTWKFNFYKKLITNLIRIKSNSLPSPSKIFKELLSGKTLIFMKILNTTIKAISIATIEIFLIGFKNKNFNFFFH